MAFRPANVIVRLLVPAAALGVGLAHAALLDARIPGRAAAQSPTAQRAATPASEAGQAPITGGVISGRVIGGDTGQPLRHAWVALTDAQPTLTDSEGRFEFTRLPAGRYHLSARKRTYLLLEHGQRRPGEPGKLLELTARQVLDVGDFVLPRASVIGGVILDDAGEPVPGVVITVLRRRFVNGAWRLVPVASASPDPTVTDDLGQYRIGNLPPGTYYLAALPPAEKLPEGAAAYAPTYYPGSFDSAAATPVFLGVGSERLDLYFPLVAGVPIAVSGVVVDSRGRPLAGAIVRSFQTIGDPAAGDGMDGPRATTRYDGTFRLPRVRPGLHRLTVDALSTGTGEQEHGETLINAMGVDADSVFLATAANWRASGRVRVDTAATVPYPASRVSIIVSGVDGAPPVLADASTPNWTFEVRGIRPGAPRFFGVTGVPTGWDVASVRCAGRDITDTGIEVSPNQRLSDVEIVLTDRSTELSGTVMDAEGRKVNDYTVVVFSEDRAKCVWRSRSIARTSADQDGRFVINGLRPGPYFAVAVDYLEEGTEYDPEVLESLRAIATRLSLEPGDKKAVKIQVRRGDH